MRDFDFPDIDIEHISGNPGDALVVRSRRTLHTLSSATVGGGSAALAPSSIATSTRTTTFLTLAPT